MVKFKLFLLKIGIINTSPKTVKKWARKNQFELLKYSAINGDFYTRKEVAIELINFDQSQSIPLLTQLIHDKVFTVADNAIESLNSFKISNEIVNEITSVLSYWDEREKKLKEAWKNTKTSDGISFDKSQMKRLNQLKNLLGKQKGSMSIG